MSNNILNTVVTLSRNISGEIFPHMLNEKEGKSITKKVFDVVKPLGKYSTFDFSSIKEDVESEYLAKGYISMPLVDNSNFSGFIISKDNKCRIYVNSANHIEINIVSDTLNLSDSLNTAIDIERNIGKSIEYSFDDTLGYLTSDISILGTGLKVMVDVFMPVVKILGRDSAVASMLSKIGVDIVDVSDEYNMSGVYRVSNAVTLGKSEEQIVSIMDSAIKKLLDIEQEESSKYLKNNINKVKNNVYRAYGILKNSFTLTIDEEKEYMSYLHFGANMGLISFENPIEFSKLLVETKDVILKNRFGTQDVDTIDRQRAEYLYKNLSMLKR